MTSPPFSGDDMTAAQFLRREIPPSMKGNGWSCLIAGLAASEQVFWDNAPLVERMMFLATANGIWLDRRAAGLGLERPPNVGMQDEPFRNYAIQISSQQMTIPAILEALKVFYGIEAVQANIVAAVEPYVLVDGQSLSFTFDGISAVTIVLHAQDFANIAAATAQEVVGVLNREFLMQHIGAVAGIAIDPVTGANLFRVYTNTLGARGSVEVDSSAAQIALGFATTARVRLLDMPRAAYVLTRGKGHVEVVMPATTDVVARTILTACYLSEDASTPGVGPYLYEGINKGLSITQTVTAMTGAPLLKGQGYRLLSVTSSAGFPDQQGFVVFGYGWSYQVGPVPYLGVAGPTSILIDPNFSFPVEVPTGATINMLVSDRPITPKLDEAGDFFLTDSPAGRVAAAADVDAIAAAGYVITKTILYPSDVGLGYAGHPKHGVPDISTIVGCFAGSDVDAETDTARTT